MKRSARDARGSTHGTWTAPWSTPSPTGSSASSRWRNDTAGPGHASTAWLSSALDLIDSATYMREHMVIDLTPREIIEELLVGVVHRIEQEMPWRPGARRAARGAERERRPVRARHHVLASVRASRFSGHCPRGPSTSWSAATRSRTASRIPSPTCGRLSSWAALPERPLRSRTRTTGATSAEAAGCRVLVVPSQVEMQRKDGLVLRETLVGLKQQPRGSARLSGPGVRRSARRPSAQVQWRIALSRTDSDGTDTGPGHTSRGATMRVNRAFAAPAAVAMTAVMLSAAVAPAVAKDGDVRRSGSCSPSGTWKVKASPEDRTASRSRARWTATGTDRSGTGRSGTMAGSPRR